MFPFMNYSLKKCFLCIIIVLCIKTPTFGIDLKVSTPFRNSFLGTKSPYKLFSSTWKKLKFEENYNRFKYVEFLSLTVFKMLWFFFGFYNSISYFISFLPINCFYLTLFKYSRFIRFALYNKSCFSTLVKFYQM